MRNSLQVILYSGCSLNIVIAFLVGILSSSLSHCLRISPLWISFVLCEFSRSMCLVFMGIFTFGSIMVEVQDHISRLFEQAYNISSCKYSNIQFGVTILLDSVSPPLQYHKQVAQRGFAMHHIVFYTSKHPSMTSMLRKFIPQLRSIVDF